ncbi:MAG: transposase [Cyanobacteria bacterium P01_B01_bin.77]
MSRGGKDRRQKAPQADDHDTEWTQVLVPFGILNMQTDELTMYVGESAETPDFIVDCLTYWWQDNQADYPEVSTLAINLDGGIATRSNRKHLIKRLVTFARDYQITIELIYYPPYHSKYNPIERYWTALEQYWNGTILDSVETVIQWTSNMMWKGFEPVVHHVTQVYEKGIMVDSETLATFKVDWVPDNDLPKWAVTINPA